MVIERATVRLGGWAKRLMLVVALARLLALSPALVLASGPGTAAGDSLSLGMGPRAAAMGEAFTGLADDASAIYWNPAGMSRLYAPEAVFNYTNLFGDTEQHYLAFVHPDPGKGTAWGGSLSYLRVMPFQGYDDSAGKTQMIQAYDTVLTFGGARRWDRFAFGATAKYISSNLAGVSAQTPSADAGVSWLSRSTAREGRFDLGLAGSNLFGGLKYDSQQFPLPRSYRLGASWSKTLVDDDPLTLSADLIRADTSKNTQLGLGAEYWLVNIVALRAGFRGGQDIGSGFRAGIGLRLRNIEFDYAYAGFGDLGMVHRAAVSVRFGHTAAPASLEVSRLFERADYLDAQGRYMEEVLTLNRILDLDPANAKAVERMKSAAEKVKKEQKP